MRDPNNRRTSRPSRYLGILFLLTAASALVAALGLFYLDHLKVRAIERIEEAISKAVSYEHMGLCLQDGVGFKIQGLSIRDRATGETVLDAEYLCVGVRIRDLFKNKVSIKGVYLYRPRLFVSRDASGTVNIADLFSTAYVRETYGGRQREALPIGSFSVLLWKDRFVISDGEIVFRDSLSPGRDRSVTIRGLDLRMERPLLASSLNIEGECIVATGEGRDSPFRMMFKGRLRGVAEARSLSEIESELSLQTEGLPLHEIVPFLAKGACAEGLQGRAAMNITFRGHYPFPSAFDGTAAVSGLQWECPAVFQKPLCVAHASLEFHGAVSRDGFRLEKIGASLDEMKVRGAIALSRLFDGGPRHLDAHFATGSLGLPQAWRFLPTGVLDDDVWDFLMAMTRGGSARLEADLSGDLEQFSRLDVPEGQKVLRLRIFCENVLVVLPVQESYLPFERVSGLIDLRDGHLFFRDFSASYGSSSLTNIEGWIQNIHRPRSHLDVKAVVEFPFALAIQELDHGIIPEDVRRIARSLSSGSGDGVLSLQILYDYGRGGNNLSVVGKTHLQNVNVHYSNMPLERVSGDIEFTDTSIALKGLRGSWAKAAMAVDGEVELDREKGPRGTLQFALDSLSIEELAGHFGAEVQGKLEGAISARGIMRVPGTEGGSWNAQVRSPNISIYMSDKRLRLSLENLALEEGPGGRISVVGLAARVKGNTVTGSGYFEKGSPGRLHLDLASPRLDWGEMWETVKGPSPTLKRFLPGKLLRERTGEDGQVGSSRFDDLDVDCTLKAERVIVGTVDLSSVSLKALKEKEAIHISDFRAAVDGGRISLISSFWPAKGRVPFQANTTLDGVGIEAMLASFRVDRSPIEGTVFVSSEVKGTWSHERGWKKDLAGDVYLDSRGGLIRRYEIISKIFTLINFTQWSSVRLSDLKARGLPYKRISGHLRLGGGRVSTEDLLIDTSVASVAAVGSYNYIDDDFDLQLAVKPLEQLDSAMDQLPFVGKILKGQDGTTAVFYYTLSGPLKDPRAAVIPFKGTNERLRTFFEGVWSSMESGFSQSGGR